MEIFSKHIIITFIIPASKEVLGLPAWPTAIWLFSIGGANHYCQKAKIRGGELLRKFAGNLCGSHSLLFIEARANVHINLFKSVGSRLLPAGTFRTLADDCISIFVRYQCGHQMRKWKAVTRRLWLKCA